MELRSRQGEERAPQHSRWRSDCRRLLDLDRADADLELLISYLVGGRDAEYAMMLMEDLRHRVTTRMQLTTDGHRPIYGQSKRRSALMSTTASSSSSMALRQSLRKPPAAIARPNALARGGTRLPATPIRSTQHVLCREGEFDDADGDAPLHAVD